MSTFQSWQFSEPDEGAGALARARQDRLTKPTGSLGRLEDLAVDLARFQGDPVPSVRPAAVLLFAADHPVTRHGVSPYPSAVTRAMLDNFAGGGAAASVLSRTHRLPLVVVDVGVEGASARASADPPLHEGQPMHAYRDPVADAPAGDLRVEDAMTPEVFESAVAAGRRAVQSLGPIRLLILGEMGIGNTTAASAVCAGILGGDPSELVGRGTGATGSMLLQKRAVVRDALLRLGAQRDPREVLRRVGGRDLAALFGAMGEAVSRRILVLVDGFIVCAAALALIRSEPRSRAGLLFAHRSAERGHARVLTEVGADPLLDLGLRLGEGSGALLAYPLLEQACALHAQMATFESAGVPDRAPT